MDKDAPGTSIQDQYLTRARKDRWWLTVFLNSGKTIGGGSSASTATWSFWKTAARSRWCSDTRSRDGAPAGEDTGMRGEETGGRTTSGSTGAPPGSPGVE